MLYSKLVKKTHNVYNKGLKGSKIFPLSNIVEAQKEFLNKKHVGKIVLKIE